MFSLPCPVWFLSCEDSAADGLELKVYLHLVLRLGTSGAITFLPLYAFMALTGTTTTFTFTFAVLSQNDHNISVSGLYVPCWSFDQSSTDLTGWFCTFYRVSPGKFWIVCSWMRRCATSLKVASLTPDGVIGFFHWLNTSGGFSGSCLCFVIFRILIAVVLTIQVFCVVAPSCRVIYCRRFGVTYRLNI